MTKQSRRTRRPCRYWSSDQSLLSSWSAPRQGRPRCTSRRSSGRPLPSHPGASEARIFSAALSSSAGSACGRASAQGSSRCRSRASVSAKVSRAPRSGSTTARSRSCALRWLSQTAWCRAEARRKRQPWARRPATCWRRSCAKAVSSCHGPVVSRSQSRSQSPGLPEEFHPIAHTEMNWRTKSVFGRARISAGLPICSIRPIDMTTTRSASSIASS